MSTPLRSKRHQKNKSPIQILFEMPWWVSFSLGIVVLISCKWVLPAYCDSNRVLKPLASMLAHLSGFVAGIFFITSIIGCVYTHFKNLKKSTASGPASKRSGWEQRIQVSKGPALMEAGMSVITSARQEQANKPTAWSISLIHSLEWKQFEDVCQKLYELQGIKSQTTPLGPDGGVDILLFENNSDIEAITSVVQCKAWGTRDVGVKPIRELLEVMTHKKIANSTFMTSSAFTEEAIAVAQENNIYLIDGKGLLEKIAQLPQKDQDFLLSLATEGDFEIPTCPSCGTKMRSISGKAGKPDFWGCPNFPRCRQLLGKRSTKRLIKHIHGQQ